MATWGSRGLRGEQFELMINQSNEKYRELRMALIQKIPTPIKPVEIDDERHITLAYFEKKSTVDYMGVVQTYPVCFDAKECSSESFPISNIHEHQYEFMKDFEMQGGIAFILIHFTNLDKVYYLRFAELKKFYERAQNGEKKSFHVNELEEEFYISEKLGVPIHYLEGLNKDIKEHLD